MNWDNFMYRKLCQHNFKYQTEGCLTANFLMCLLIELTKSQSQTDVYNTAWQNITINPLP